MNSIRVKFIRGEEVKFISHLDLMKVFERAIRRSKLPVKYSQGFNPHLQMVFGLPLSVGVTSESEYADIDVSEAINPDEFMEKLNEQLPMGLRITEAGPKNTKDNIMATIIQASYEVLVSSQKDVGINIVKGHLEDLLAKQVITVKKETKSGLKDVDIRPMIYNAEIKELGDHTAPVPVTGNRDGSNSSEGGKCLNPWIINYAHEIKLNNETNPSSDEENMFCLSMRLSAGSAANLKPELLVAAFNEATDPKLKLIKIHRTGLFTGKEGRVLDPLDAAVLLSV